MGLIKDAVLGLASSGISSLASSASGGNVNIPEYKTSASETAMSGGSKIASLLSDSGKPEVAANISSSYKVEPENVKFNADILNNYGMDLNNSNNRLSFLNSMPDSALAQNLVNQMAQTTTALNNNQVPGNSMGLTFQDHLKEIFGK